MSSFLQYVFRISELERLGYVYCEATRWWWSTETKTCVDDNTIHTNYDNFVNKVLNMQEVNGYSFYSYKQSNRDILETIYRKRFPVFKQLKKEDDE